MVVGKGMLPPYGEARILNARGGIPLGDAKGLL